MFSRTREFGEYPLGLPVLRAKRHPVPQRLRAAIASSSSRPPTSSRPESRRIAPNTSLATSVRPDPRRPASPDDLAGPQREIERRHDAASPQSLSKEDRPSLHGPMVPLQPLFGFLELTSEHQRNEFQARKLRRRAFADEAAVAQHRYAVGDPVNLVEKMGDEDDRDASALEIAQNLEQKLDLVGVETGGRLVEHEHPRIVLERPRDRDQLLDRQRVGRRGAARRRCRS